MTAYNSRAGRAIDGRAQPSFPNLRLDATAAQVFGLAEADDDALRAIAEAGQQAMLAGAEGETGDLAFFLIAWAAERMAAERIAAGDLGIDAPLAEISARVAAESLDSLAEDTAWAGLVAEYRALADEILIETLNDLREFAMVVLYSGRREEYARRWAAGMHALGRACPEAARRARLTPSCCAPMPRETLPLLLAG